MELGIQILTRWHGQEVDSQGWLSEEGLQKIIQRADALVNEKSSGETGLPSGTFAKAYLSNREHFLACDLALQFVTASSGFTDFHMEQLPGKLKAGETRFFVEVKDLPAEIQRISEGFLERSCIHNPIDNSTRLEVLWSEPRPSIWTCGDMGSAAWKWKMKGVYVFQLRGGERPDPPHREQRCRENAINASNGKYIK